MESFGTRLADIRRQHNLTQNDIADRLNISAQAVSKWENDLTMPDIDTMIKLSDIFNMSLDELAGKQKKEPVLVAEEKRKDIDSMVLRTRIESRDGDIIKFNLPMAAVRLFINNKSTATVFSGNSALESVDFEQIYRMAEQGLIGELVSIESADGDHVTVTVE